MAAKGKTLKFFTAITLIVIVAFIAAPLAASCNILDRKPHYDFKPCKISKPHYGVSEKIPSIVLLEKHDFTRQTLGSNGCWLRQLHQTDQIIYSGPNVIAEYNAGSVATSPGNEYIYSGGIDSLTMVAFNNNAKRLSAFRNQQWSIVGLVDFDTQVLEEQYAYNVFGERTILDSGGTVRTTSSFNNRYGYTSREHDDETGLMYFRARYYNPATGEFISQDPVGYVDGPSVYRMYALINGIDPYGLQEKLVLTIRNQFPDPKNRSTSRTKIGVGENALIEPNMAVDTMYMLPNPVPNANPKFTFLNKDRGNINAGERAAKVTIVAKKGNCKATLDLKIVEPSKVTYALHDKTVYPFPARLFKARLIVTVHPLDVSFANVQIGEGSAKWRGTGIWSHFEGLDHHPGTTFVDLNRKNQHEFDKVTTGLVDLTKWRHGDGLAANIPQLFKVKVPNGRFGAKVFDEIQQTATYEPNGRGLCISKGNLIVCEK